MKLLFENWRRYLNEVSGQGLERYATFISREVVKALKDDIIKNAFARLGEVNFRLGDEGMEFLEDLDWVRHIKINLEAGRYVYTDAKYEFILDATDEERKESDIIINIVLPKSSRGSYDDSVFSELIPELKDSLRHELEHSSQPTDMLMQIQKEIPEGDVWKSVDAAETYYTNEAEVKAHVAGIYKKAKMLKEPASEVMDDFLMQIWQTGMANGYSEQELEPLMTKIRELWRYYMASRYPHAELDWGEEM